MVIPTAIASVITTLVKLRAERSDQRRAFQLQKDRDRWDRRETKRMQQFFRKMASDKCLLSPLQKRLLCTRRFDELSEAEVTDLFPDQSTDE